MQTHAAMTPQAVFVRAFLHSAFPFFDIGNFSRVIIAQRKPKSVPQTKQRNTTMLNLQHSLPSFRMRGNGTKRESAF